jgi:hypothetical protein
VICVASEVIKAVETSCGLLPSEQEAAHSPGAFAADCSDSLGQA